MSARGIFLLSFLAGASGSSGSDIRFDHCFAAPSFWGTGIFFVACEATTACSFRDIL